jgi:hypothetical protein
MNVAVVVIRNIAAPIIEAKMDILITVLLAGGGLLEVVGGCVVVVIGVVIAGVTALTP